MKVTLLGAGPYDKGLMTIKGMEALEKADVVFYDRLVGDEIISLIPKNAEKINVGKASSNHTIPQEEINNMLLKKAQQGLNVVRLKGGDPFVFGRGGEELELLAQNNIDFEVIPGISSSIAVATYAGIPVTHRDYASSLHIITGHKKNNIARDIDFKSLTNLNGTVILMMSIGGINEIMQGFIESGMDINMPVAVIENGCSSKSRKFISTISDITKVVNENKVQSPSIIVIGKVCKLSEKLDWFSKKPLKNTRVIVVKVKNGISKLSKGLKNLGSDVIEFSNIKIISKTAANIELDNSIKNIGEYTWIVFTSCTGVNIYFDYLKEIKKDIRLLNNIKIAVIGTETEKELQNRGVFADFVPNKYDSNSLSKGLLENLTTSDKLLLIRAEKGTTEMEDILKSNFVNYERINIYDSSYEKSELVNSVIEKDIDFITFTSVSGVESFAKSVNKLDFSKLTAVCIGERTEKKAKECGFRTIIADNCSTDSMIDKILMEVEK